MFVLKGNVRVKAKNTRNLDSRVYIGIDNGSLARFDLVAIAYVSHGTYIYTCM